MWFCLKILRDAILGTILYFLEMGYNLVIYTYYHSCLDKIRLSSTHVPSVLQVKDTASGGYSRVKNKKTIIQTLIQKYYMPAGLDWVIICISWVSD